MSGLISCDDKLNSITSLLSVLQGNTGGLSSSISDQITSINIAVSESLLSPLDVVIDAAETMTNQIDCLFPDFTNRLNNSECGIQTYDNEFNTFKSMLDKCPDSKLKSFIQLLDIPGFSPWNLSDIDAVVSSSSQLRKKMRDIASFPTSYLRSKRGEMLNQLRSQLEDVTGGLREFAEGNNTDILEQLLPRQINELAQEIESVLLCIEQLACGDSSGYRTEFNSLMTSLPLDPPFTQNVSNKIKPITNFKLDRQKILSETDASESQQLGLLIAGTSFTSAMGSARRKATKYE